MTTFAHKNRAWFLLIAGFVLILATAIAVVSTAHLSRQHYVALEVLNKQQSLLAAQASRLTLEYTTLTNMARIEASATELGMLRAGHQGLEVVQ